MVLRTEEGGFSHRLTQIVAFAVSARDAEGNSRSANYLQHFQDAVGFGFLERVYQRSLHMELGRLNLKAEIEHKIPIQYKGQPVGDYQADLLVEEKVLIEVKVAPNYCPSDEAQLLNELKATGLRVGLLLNFGRAKVEFRRFVF